MNSAAVEPSTQLQGVRLKPRDAPIQKTFAAFQPFDLDGAITRQRSDSVAVIKKPEKRLSMSKYAVSKDKAIQEEEEEHRSEENNLREEAEEEARKIPITYEDKLEEFEFYIKKTFPNSRLTEAENVRVTRKQAARGLHFLFQLGKKLRKQGSKKEEKEEPLFCDSPMKDRAKCVPQEEFESFLDEELLGGQDSSDSKIPLRNSLKEPQSALAGQMSPILNLNEIGSPHVNADQKDFIDDVSTFREWRLSPKKKVLSEPKKPAHRTSDIKIEVSKLVEPFDNPNETSSTKYATERPDAQVSQSKSPIRVHNIDNLLPSGVTSEKESLQPSKKGKKKRRKKGKRSKRLTIKMEHSSLATLTEIADDLDRDRQISDKASLSSNIQKTSATTGSRRGSRKPTHRLRKKCSSNARLESYQSKKIDPQMKKRSTISPLHDQKKAMILFEQMNALTKDLFGIDSEVSDVEPSNEHPPARLQPAASSPHSLRTIKSQGSNEHSPTLNPPRMRTKQPGRSFEDTFDETDPDTSNTNLSLHLHPVGKF